MKQQTEKKLYETPIMEMVQLDVSDFITSSSCDNDCSGQAYETQNSLREEDCSDDNVCATG